ncbi:heparinase II/III family protein [Nonomuraea typhae]|uniref:Heparinase II/III family protein n=1 Tax=Nonomuraea typhae TaxID=2603600 RepID=A0ABW7YV10_9ACTN
MFFRRARERRAVCLSARLPAMDADELLSGRVRLAGLPPVNLGERVDWRADPHGNRSWMLNLHTLRWAGSLAAAYERTGEARYLDRALAVAHDWIAANPEGDRETSPWAWAEHPIALRAPVLVCLAAHTRSAPLEDSLARHAQLLADPASYRAGHNHGLDQDIGLLVTACHLGRPRLRDLAIRRMTASAELAIDDQGVLHEQAPRYAVYVHARLGIALEAIAAAPGADVPPRRRKIAGPDLPSRLSRRRAALEEHIQHATRPDGYLLPIGDGPADARPPAFSPAPAETVRVYDGGYVFGRTAWNDPGSAHYSIRFGPGRKLHGHEDHLGVTYYAHGRPILVEAGFHSYEKTPYTTWTRLPEAHNVPVVEGARFRPGTATRLRTARITPRRQSFTLDDTAYGVSRVREVVVHHGPDVLAVQDRVEGGATARSLWHFAPSLRVLTRGKGLVVLEDEDGWQVTLAQFTLPGGAPAHDSEVRRGLVSPGARRTAEVEIVVSPAAAALLTLIVPGCAAPEIAVADGGVSVTTPEGTAPCWGWT